MFNKTPMEKIINFLGKNSNWTSVSLLNENEPYLYYNKFPEYTIQGISNEDKTESFSEKWVRNFPNKQSSKKFIQIKFFTTILSEFLCVYVDGGRYLVVAPKTKFNKKKNKSFYYYIKGSIEYKLTLLVAHFYSGHGKDVIDGSFFNRAGIRLYENKKEAGADF